MNKIIVILLLLLNLGINKAYAQAILAGGNTGLYLLENNANDTIPKVLWHWDPRTAKDLPAAYSSKTGYLKTIGECKPVHNGEDILITSSSGGVVLINRVSNKVLFYAYVFNAHSAELLPSDKVVVAGSGSPGTKGNCVEVFDLKVPEKSLFKDTLPAAHGVIWDAKRKVLFALGYSELKQYHLNNWGSSTPSLKLIKSVPLPDKQGHDLQRFDEENKLILTTHANVWLYNIAKNQFETYKPLANKVDIKSTSKNYKTGFVTYTRAEISWWTHHIYFVNSPHYLVLPDINIYKARWLN